MKASEIPLLSRPEVLFPGSLVQVCFNDFREIGQLRRAREGSFGFCLFHPAEGENAARHMRLGTEAIIEDYSQTDSGGLRLKFRGGRRFQIQRTRCLHDGQLVAQVDWLPEEPLTQVPLDYAVIVQLIARYMEKAQADYPQFRPQDCENASFVGFRLAELLPMEVAEKQMLLELEDPVQRLKMLATILPRFQAE
ncbi:MAG: LON peptidase substrate-binding domain-containing protein [Xanthomonadales bacterium]|nr:LON peptidase substrate-binding domain-containing protein [Xanthomonadales bacterium]